MEILWKHAVSPKLGEISVFYSVFILVLSGILQQFPQITGNHLNKVPHFAFEYDYANYKKLDIFGTILSVNFISTPIDA